MSLNPEWLQALVGEAVVVDCDAPFVVCGRLLSASAHHLELADADLHDLREGSSSREVYVLETRQLGVRVNRRRVSLPLAQVVAVSRLQDVSP
jgi:hypothetical protein